jgi:TRAP-type mannitol/chloroaromatic compound transport system substrate-binding protein
MLADSTKGGSQMDRRSFLRGSSATAVAAGAAAASSAMPAPAIAQNKMELKLVTTWPKNFPGLGTSAQRMADRITNATEGRITVKLFGAGEIVPAFESFDAVANETADLYHGAEYYWQGKSKAFSFFTAVPFGLTAQEMNAWIYHGGGQELWDELGAEFGIKPFAACNTGVQMGGWFKQPVEKLEDMKGLKFRMPGLGGEVLRQVGVSVVNLPGGEVFPALQSGAIDGTEWVGPWNDLAFGFHKVTKHYHWPGIHEPGTVLSSGINKKLWDSLSASDQAIIENAMAAENNVGFAEFNARNGGSLETLRTEHGVELHRFNDEILKALGEAANDVLSDVAAEGGITKRVHDSFREFQKKSVAWMRYSEQGFMTARDLTV